MNTQRNTILVTVGGLLLLCASVAASAQTPTPNTGGATQPSAASSPQQRASTSVGTAEAPTGEGSNPADASSPHQRQALGDAAHAAVSPASFVKKAAQDGMTEVKLAELAQQKSQSDAVKNFAMHMQQDHSKANSELQSIASSKSLTTPTSLDAKHQKIVDELSSKSGAAFDRAYANVMVKDHKQAIALFKQAQNSKDPDIASFAAKTLPTLQEHQQLANQLHSQVKVAAAGSNASTR
jgi:putative membrane protein